MSELDTTLDPRDTAYYSGEIFEIISAEYHDRVKTDEPSYQGDPYNGRKYVDHVVGGVHEEALKTFTTKEINALMELRSYMETAIYYIDDIILEETDDAQHDETRTTSIGSSRRIMHDIESNLDYIYRDLCDPDYPTMARCFSTIKEARDRILLDSD